MQSNVKKKSFESISNAHNLCLGPRTKNGKPQVKTNIFAK
jgi:hypothetical protein